MISTLAATTVALAAAQSPLAETHPGWGFGWWFLFIPLFWILIIGLVIALVGGRRRRYWAQYGYGPGAWGPWAASGAASAETVLSERYARGDIDEKEYRVRLEVLRAAGPRPTPPKA